MRPLIAEAYPGIAITSEHVDSDSFIVPDQQQIDTCPHYFKIVDALLVQPCWRSPAIHASVLIRDAQVKTEA